MVCPNTIKTVPIQCHSMYLMKKSGRPSMKRFGMRLSHICLKNGGRTNKKRKQVRQWQVKNVERTHEDKFSWSRCPYDMYWNATAVLKIDSVYKQSKNYHPQVYVEECKYTNAENQQCSMLSDDDDGFFEV